MTSVVLVAMEMVTIVIMATSFDKSKGHYAFLARNGDMYQHNIRVRQNIQLIVDSGKTMKVQ